MHSNSQTMTYSMRSSARTVMAGKMATAQKMKTLLNLLRPIGLTRKIKITQTKKLQTVVLTMKQCLKRRINREDENQERRYAKKVKLSLCSKYALYGFDVTPICWMGCAIRFPKPTLYLRPKTIIFPSSFMY